MNWIKGKRAEIENLYCVDKLREDWRVCFNVKDYTPTEEESEREDAPDCEFLCGTIKGNPSDWDIKQVVLKAQDEYDKSGDVNCFYVNDEETWMNKDTRVGLTNSIAILEAAGGTEYTVWFNNKPYTASIDTFKQLLAAVELYAMKCYGVTEQHKAEIEAIESKEGYFSYDITAGYPEKLHFSVPEA